MKRDKERIDKDPGHVIRMWTLFHLKINKDYHFYRDSFSFRLFYAVIKAIVAPILFAFNWIVFGFRINGAEKLKKIKDTGAVSVCNHVHILDCTMIGCAFWDRRQYFLTLQSNLEIPVIGRLVKILGGMPVPRELRFVSSCYEAVGKALSGGTIVQVYPEGVLIPRYDGLREFKRGAFSFSYDYEVPLIPMVITYRKAKGIQRLFHRNPLLTLTILDPIYPVLGNNRRKEITRLKECCFEKMKQVYQEKGTHK